MLYENIKKICSKNNLTFGKIERSTGLANGTISGWKKSIPSAKSLKMVADYVGVSMDELYTGGDADE